VKIKYTSELMGLMAIFQQVTRAKLKDCFFDSNSLLIFVVEPNELGKAIGKKAVNIKRLEKSFNKKKSAVDNIADEIMHAYNLSTNSVAVAKKLELERQADSSR